MAAYLAGPEFLRRFETERQLLATLSHNNITRLIDGGVSSAGDPFLITEYVDGQTIDRYCDERKLDVDRRLRIFLQVCDAVDYAHRNSGNRRENTSSGREARGNVAFRTGAQGWNSRNIDENFAGLGIHAPGRSDPG